MRELNDWFLKNQRDLPWRKNRTPYRVWVSEVMLQQTRASVAVPYFEKWMFSFPALEDLARAPIEKVIKLWEGLGYYSRARNLHRSAQIILEKFGGKIPSAQEELALLPGLGPYTIGAILSFGFKKKAPAVDGNVTRVLARYFCIEENVEAQRVKRKMEALAESLLDSEEPWVTAEALIELGATVCTPNPRCDMCPLKTGCLGKERAFSLPIKKKGKEPIRLKRGVVCLESEGKILVKNPEPGKVMGDLYEFPYFEMEGEIWPLSKIEDQIEGKIRCPIRFFKRLPIQVHTFTKYRAELYPFLFFSSIQQELEGHIWIDRNRLEELPFSSGHRKILKLLKTAQR